MGLKEFLVDLGTNPTVQRRYAEDPEGLIRAAQLTPQERAAFESGNSTQIRSALGKPDNDCMSQTGQKVPVGSTIVMPDSSKVPVTENSLLVCENDFAPLLKAIKKVGARKAGGRAKKASSRKRGKKR